MVKFKSLSLKTIRETLSAELQNCSSSEESLFVSELAEPLEVASGGISFLISESFLKEIPQTKAAVLVINRSLLDKAKEVLPGTVKALLVLDDAYLGLAQFSEKLATQDPYGDWRMSKENMALPIHPTAQIDPSVQMAAGVCVGENTTIGARTVLLPNVVVGPNVKIGEDCVLFPGVIVYPSCQIGSRVRLHASVVIGGDGFGYAKSPKGSVKIWHLGRTILQDDVEVGPGSTIDRGTLKDTIVERGAKIDNLVQIGHNVHVRSHAILCAQVGLAGNATVGRGAILAGKVGVADKINIGDGAIIGPMTGLSKDAEPGVIIMGSIPGRPRREWWKLVAFIDKLPELIERIKKLEKKG